MRRPAWLAAGVVVGVTGTLWAEQRVRRAVRQAVDRLAPEQVALGARDSARQLGDRVRAAVEAGREARDQREGELWAALDPRPAAAPDPDPGTDRRRGSDGSGRRGGGDGAIVRRDGAGRRADPVRGRSREPR